MNIGPGLRLLRAADRASTRWKNGGGETAEVCVFPPGAGLEDFDARVSLAGIDRNGPFSRFDGVARSLAVVSGAGLTLDLGAGPPARLTPQSPPFDFPGEAPAQARLIDGPVLALNAMSRRGRCRLTRLDADAPLRLPPQSRFALVCTAGVWRLDAPGSPRLRPLDALAGDGAAGEIALAPEGGAVAYLIALTAL